MSKTVNATFGVDCFISMLTKPKVNKSQKMSKHNQSQQL